MPINIPDRLPAAKILLEENIFVMNQKRAEGQHIRPLNVLILNLMPKKIESETQFMRLLSNTPLQVNIELLRIDNRPSKHTSDKHLHAFYRQFEQIEQRNYDGLIITGAPLGLVEFHDIVYWQHLETILAWACNHVTSIMYVCWAVQAGLNLLYRLPKQTRSQKLSGIYAHNICENQGHESKHPLLRGFDDYFMVPHSRYADFSETFIREQTDLDILVTSAQAGLYLAATPDKRHVFVTGHPEYDVFTLDREYRRDIKLGLTPQKPENYYLNDDENKKPAMLWRSHGNLLFSNWLNYCVYQQTPFDLSQFSTDNFTIDDEQIF